MFSLQKKMFNLIYQWPLVLTCLFSQVAQAQSGQFTCPVKGSPQTPDQMYSGMLGGLVWSYAAGPIIFVAEDPEIYRSVVASTYGNDTRGTFKIGYNYQAKECRRQIILDEQIDNGVYDGYLAIEVCDPKLMRAFQSAQGQSIDEVITKGNLPASLALNPTQETVVSYYKDAKGTILPRFKIKLDRIEYSQDQNGNCVLFTDVNDNYQGYAGVGSFYDFKYSWTQWYQGQVWTFDQNGQSVLSTFYDGQAIGSHVNPALTNNPTGATPAQSPVATAQDEENIPAPDSPAETVVHEVDTYTINKMYEAAATLHTEAFSSELLKAAENQYLKNPSFENLTRPKNGQSFAAIELMEGNYKCALYDSKNSGRTKNDCSFEDGHLLTKSGTMGYQGHFYTSILGMTVFVGVAQYGRGDHEAEFYSKFENRLPTFGLELEDGSDSLGVLAADPQRKNYYLHMHLGTENHKVIHIWQE